MTSTTQILPEKPKDTYCEVNHVDETPRRAWSLGDDWRASTTLWMLAVAILMWLVTYLITVLVAMYYDCGVRSVISLTTYFGWTNGTSSVISLNEENTKYLVTYN